MRKFIYLFTSFVALALLTINASHAVYDPNAKHSKWFNDSIVNDPLVKSSVEVKAQRTYPVSTLDSEGKPILQNKTQKSTVKLAANANRVGKTLFKRVPVGVITQALLGLGIGALDWVLDPANNAVKYTLPGGQSGVGQNYPWIMPNFNIGGYSATDACKLFFSTRNKAFHSVQSYGPDNYGCFYSTPTPSNPNASSLAEYVTRNKNYQGETQPPSVEKSIPMDDVAQQVIKDADAGDPAAQQVMSDTALDMLEEGLLDSSLEAAAEPKQFDEGETDPTDPSQSPDPETPTDPETQPFQFPPFCDWASKVCDFIDWVQTEPIDPDESGDISVEQPDPDMHVGILERLYIDMPAACPADPILEFMGAKIPFPMSIFCQFAEMMKPLILLFAYIKGLSIIGNGLT